MGNSTTLIFDQKNDGEFYLFHILIQKVLVNVLHPFFDKKVTVNSTSSIFDKKVMINSTPSIFCSKVI